MRQLGFTLTGIAMMVMGGRIGLQVVQRLSPDALGMAVGLALGILASVPMMVYLASPRRGQTLVVTHHQVHRLDTGRVVDDPAPATASDDAILALPAGEGREVYREVV